MLDGVLSGDRLWDRSLVEIAAGGVFRLVLVRSIKMVGCWMGANFWDSSYATFGEPLNPGHVPQGLA